MAAVAVKIVKYLLSCLELKRIFGAHAKENKHHSNFSTPGAWQALAHCDTMGPAVSTLPAGLDPAAVLYSNVISSRLSWLLAACWPVAHTCYSGRKSIHNTTSHVCETYCRPVCNSSQTMAWVVTGVAANLTCSATAAAALLRQPSTTCQGPQPRHSRQLPLLLPHRPYHTPTRQAAQLSLLPPQLLHHCCQPPLLHHCCQPPLLRHCCRHSCCAIAAAAA